MPTKPCLDCGRLIRFTHGDRRPRCDDCARVHERERGTSTQRGYDHAWRQVRAVVLDRDGHVCHYCGGPAGTVDHVVPLAQGGPRLDPENLVACCRRCNSARSARARRDSGEGFVL